MQISWMLVYKKSNRQAAGKTTKMDWTKSTLGGQWLSCDWNVMLQMEKNVEIYSKKSTKDWIWTYFMFWLSGMFYIFKMDKCSFCPLCSFSTEKWTIIHFVHFSMKYKTVEEYYFERNQEWRDFWFHPVWRHFTGNNDQQTLEKWIFVPASYNKTSHWRWNAVTIHAGVKSKFKNEARSITGSNLPWYQCVFVHTFGQIVYGTGDICHVIRNFERK